MPADIHTFHVTFPGKGFNVIAVDAEDACDLAHERWGMWPTSVELMPPVAAVTR